MGIKSKLGILIIACVLVVISLSWHSQKEPYSTEAVVDSVWGKFDVQSTQVGENSVTDSVSDEINEANFVIWIDVYDKNDIPNVEKYLEENLSNDDLTQYEIEVFSNKGIDY